jgi:hypothetical protein
MTKDDGRRNSEHPREARYRHHPWRAYPATLTENGQTADPPVTRSISPVGNLEIGAPGVASFSRNRSRKPNQDQSAGE